MDWQQIETAPRDWSDVLVFSPEHDDYTNGGVFSAFYDMDLRGWYAFWPSGNMRLNPTAWMPLPAPPAHIE